jgi:D-arginine dehydrogenase
MSERFDAVIVGVGIAGASTAYFLGRESSLLRVLLVEREAMPGYHCTGHSAALFMENYWPAQVRAFARDSRSFLEAPPGGFSEAKLLQPRGALFVVRTDQRDAVDKLERMLRADGCDVKREDGHARGRVAVLRPEAAVPALFDSGAADIDVDAFHQGILRGARAAGTQLICNAPVAALRFDGEVIWAAALGGYGIQTSPAVGALRVRLVSTALG